MASTKTTTSAASQLALGLDLRRKPVLSQHGGFRPGAGRKRGHRVSHDRREAFRPTHPLHITLRVRPEVHGLRRRDAFHVVRGAIAASHKAHFRVIEFNVLHTHVHLVAETDGPRGLARGIQGLATRIAIHLNRCLGRRGRVFDDRYHARAMRTPRQVRNTLLYVLQNLRHHHPDRLAWLPWDPCSSAASFDGWASPLPSGEGWQRRALAAPRATTSPTVWLLTTGWKRRGLLGANESPAIREAQLPSGPGENL